MHDPITALSYEFVSVSMHAIFPNKRISLRGKLQLEIYIFLGKVVCNLLVIYDNEIFKKKIHWKRCLCSSISLYKLIWIPAGLKEEKADSYLEKLPNFQ